MFLLHVDHLSSYAFGKLGIYTAAVSHIIPRITQHTENTWNHKWMMDVRNHSTCSQSFYYDHPRSFLYHYVLLSLPCPNIIIHLLMKGQSRICFLQCYTAWADLGIETGTCSGLHIPEEQQCAGLSSKTMAKVRVYGCRVTADRLYSAAWV